MGYPITQSQTAQPLVFFLTNSTDHISGATGLAPTVTISKNGGAFASPAGVVSEIANGWYKVAGNATDSNTLGPLLLHATATGADPCDECFPVVSYGMQDAVRLGLTALPNTNAAATGGLPTVDAANGVKVSVGTGAGQINVSSGKVPATLASTDVTGNVAADLQTIKTQTVTCAAGVTVEPFVGTATAALVVNASGFVTVGTNNDKGGYSLTQAFPSNFAALSIDANGRVELQSGITKNTALNNFEFLLVSSTDHVTPVTGATVTATRSLDGAAFGACANAVTEVGSGIYKISLAATDTNAGIVTLKMSATGADTRYITLVTTP